MPTPRSRRPFVRALATALAVGALVLGSSLPAHADPVVSQVVGGELVASITEYNGLLYLGSEAGLQSYDGTTFTTIPGAPESPRDFVEYLGELWMVGGPVTTPADASLWRFDGTMITQYEVFGRSPVIVGADLYFILGNALGDGFLARTDGTTTTVDAGSPIDVVRIARDPNGLIALVAGPARTLWTYDGATFVEELLPGAPVNVDQLQTLAGTVVSDGQAILGDPDAAYTFDGAAFARLGPATDVGCFLENGGALYYGGNDGTRRMFSAIAGVAATEAPITPTLPAGCPRYVATDGTFYLQAQGTGGNPTLHTWDGTTLTELDSVGDFPVGLIEYGGKIYFSGQALTETPQLFVLEDITPAAPAGPLLPPTGAQVSWWLLAVAAALLAGGVGILVVQWRRPV